MGSRRAGFYSAKSRPKGLRGIDKTATWRKCNADGWVYGHGSFSLTSHKHPVLGCFLCMRNSSNEAKRLWLETLTRRLQKR